jgi:hypothetical protein
MHYAPRINSQSCSRATNHLNVVQHHGVRNAGRADNDAIVGLADQERIRNVCPGAIGTALNADAPVSESRDVAILNNQLLGPTRTQCR